MNNAKVLTENSQPVFDFMALCNRGIISRENISGIDNSNGNLISRETISGIDNSNNNIPLENEEYAKADDEAKKRAEAEAKAKDEKLKENFNLIKSRLINEDYNWLKKLVKTKDKIMVLLMES